jgi:simple sugar transport system ATP-binding protein
VAGNGQDELVEALTGLRKPTSGRVTMLGHDITNASPRGLDDVGAAFVPGDRHRYGLVLSFPLSDNLVLTRYYRPPFADGLVRHEDAVVAFAEKAIVEYDIRTPSATVPASTLSGGNQQKAIVAREFSREPKWLVLDQPTRGLDVGSIEFIHRQAIGRRDAGVAILLVSAELDEVIEVSDRIAVMYRGKIVAFLDARGASREEVGLLMATGGRAGGGIQEQVVSA